MAAITDFRPANLTVLRKRQDFLRAARALRAPSEGFLLQARLRNDAAPMTAGITGMRVGFTCSKKVGNAIERNRAKRRLRELARLVLPEHGKAGWDYVLIGRPGVTGTRDFEALKTDLHRALRKVHG